jgi:HSP20 family molecular chaperone IbpA
MLPVLKRNYENNAIKNFFQNFFDEGVLSDFFDNSGITCNREESDNIKYEIECPGFNETNLRVELIENYIEITGERESNNRKVKIDKKFLVGKAEDINATMKDGILYITLKPFKKDDTVRKIEISKDV